MLLIQGKTSKEEFVLAPINCSNWGSLLNHSANANCSSLRVIVDQEVKLLIYTTRKVQAGEELLINYNGYYDDFPTEGFEDYNAPSK